MTKLCSKCSQEKAVEDFNKDISRKDGLCSTCKQCISIRIKTKRVVDTEWRNKVNSSSRNYRKMFPQKIKVSSRNAALKHKYGISQEMYLYLLKLQDNKCAICLTSVPKTYGNTFFAVDHDHETGKVRGLLCLECNSGIGKLKDNADILRSAIKYLEEGIN